MIQTCRTCGLEAEHTVRQNGKPHVWCKACQREYSRQHYKANSAKHNYRRNINRYGERGKIREFIHESKNVPCADCGVSYPYYVMDFDHVRGTKAFNISQSIRMTLRDMETIKAEIAKCDVVCGNCHRHRTHVRRTTGCSEVV